MAVGKGKGAKGAKGGRAGFMGLAAEGFRGLELCGDLGFGPAWVPL